jgi:hypothetical protein
VTFRYVNNSDIVPHLPPDKLPAPFPPFPFPHLPRGVLDVPRGLADAASSVGTFFVGERFADLGQLRLFIDGQPVSRKMADLLARDPFVLNVPSNPLDALAGVRQRLTVDFHGDRLLDHDPRNGYLPRLRNQLPSATV